MNRVLEVLKKIWAAVRSNLSLKIVSLLFALILWNYVIAEIDPSRPVTLEDVPVVLSGESIMRQSNLTIRGDRNFAADVTVEVSRKVLSQLRQSDVTLRADLSSVARDGTQKVRLSWLTARGTIVRVEPDTITVNVERLRSKVVPVNVVPTGTLPDGYWSGTPEVRTGTTLEITGAFTDIQTVARAVVEVSLDNLTGSLSRTPPYTLLDANGAVVATGNMTLNPPNCIVNLPVYPTKMVPVSVQAEDILTGELPDGYALKSLTADPPQIEVAGPADLLEALDVLRVSRIDITNKKADFNEDKAVQPPANIWIVDSARVNIAVGIAMKMRTVTLDNLPVTVTGLGTGLAIDDKLTASVKVTCPELYYRRVTASRVHLFVDVNGLGAGQHKLAVRSELDPYLGQASAVVMPAEVTLNIRSDVQDTSLIGGMP